MSVVTVFSGTFCEEDRIIQEVINKTGYSLVTDEELVAKAAKKSRLSEAAIKRIFSNKTSVFNKFTHEKERSIAHLKLVLAEMLSGDNLLVFGFAGQLIPQEISHVLRVCLIADMSFRTSAAAEDRGLSQKEAIKLIHREDEDRGAWIGSLLCGGKSPWDSSCYDILIPVDKLGTEEAAAHIVDNLGKDVVKPSVASKKAVDDFLLAAKTEVTLTEEGHDVVVTAKNGAVTVTINRHVLMLGRLEEELKSIAGKVPGVKSVETKVGKDYYQADIYRKCDFELPHKVLLVDDEQEFVETLSERLLMRDMGSAVAYDGETALDLIREEEPEVMVLDLKMPGIDGIEVLRRVKETRPEVEVIILTGHGSEADRKACMDLGAFAYLQKPSDIDTLSDTLKKAYAKVQQKKAGEKLD